MSFKDGTWDERVETLGDIAELQFERYCKDRGIPFIRYGLNRPPLRVASLPAFIRYTPDYLTVQGLVEVQGCGNDGLIKLKHDKLWALKEWDQHDNVYFFFWNSANEEYMRVPFDRIMLLLDQGGIRVDGHFDGYKPYSAIRWDDLVGTVL